VKVFKVTFGDTDPCGLNCFKPYEDALIASNASDVRIRAPMISSPPQFSGLVLFQGDHHRAYATMSETLNAL
jgi:hypothetical protein